MLTRVVLSNLPFALALVIPQRLPLLPRTLVVGAILFLVPGLAWTNRRSGDAFVVLFRAVAISLGITVAAWLCVLVMPGLTSRVGFLLGVAALTNLGLVLGARGGWYLDSPFRSTFARAVTTLAVLFFLQSYVGAAYRIPPLEDQDMEAQGTAYGLIHAFTPTMVTNDRGTTHYFAHPLLLHFWVGASALITNDLDRLEYFHDSALAMSGSTLDELNARWEQDFKQFWRDPVLMPTRTPSVFLGVFALFPIAFVVHRLSGSLSAALGACALYATMPEVYVRSANGGYVALTNFLTMSVAYFYLQRSELFPSRDIGAERRSEPATGRHPFLGGFLAGWSDQKAIVIPLVSGAHATLRLLLDGGFRAVWRRAHEAPSTCAAFAIAAGFFGGWLTFAAYGLVVAPHDFIQDHLVGHVLDRIRMQDVNFARVAQGKWVYPSIVALWRELADHTGWLIVLPAIVALFRVGRRVRDAEGFFVLWILIAGIAFSLIDWRQTRHLSQLLPPLSVLTALLWASLQGRARSVVSAVLVAGVLWNIWRIWQLMHDFTYLEPQPIW